MAANVLIILTEESWKSVLMNGVYMHPSLDEEGFIHASTPEQVCRVANKHYTAYDKLHLMEIDPKVLKERGIKFAYEWSKTFQDHFPHIFGPVPLVAVVKDYVFSKDAEGAFELPNELQD